MRAKVILGLLSLIATNLLVGWTAYHWKDAVVMRSLNALIEKSATSERENRELQDIVADLRKKTSDFVVQAKQIDDGGLRLSVNANKPPGATFAIRIPARWGLTGVSAIQFSSEGTTEKIAGGFLFTPTYAENVTLPYDGTMVIWAVPLAYKDDAGVRAVAGDYVTSSPQYAYFAQARINSRRECKNNDRLCREALTTFTQEVQEAVKTLVTFAQ